MGIDIMWDHRVKERFNNSQYKKKMVGAYIIVLTKLLTLHLKSKNGPKFKIF